MPYCFVLVAVKNFGEQLLFLNVQINHLTSNIVTSLSQVTERWESLLEPRLLI